MALPEITEKIRRFRDESDRARFHNPKDMAMERKMAKNSARYPADKVCGSSLGYNGYGEA